MRHRHLVLLGALGLGLAACAPSSPPPAAPAPPPSVPAAPAAPNVSDLVGARGSSGEMALQQRGYQNARSRGLTSYWWNASARSCVRTVTANGRYTTVEPVAASSCGH